MTYTSEWVYEVRRFIPDHLPDLIGFGTVSGLKTDSDYDSVIGLALTGALCSWATSLGWSIYGPMNTTDYYEATKYRKNGELWHKITVAKDLPRLLKIIVFCETGVCFELEGDSTP
jgi:hypothetical protein